MTTEKIVLKVLKRDLNGQKAKQIRKQGFVVGNIVVSGKNSIPIKINSLDFERTYNKVGESTLVYLSLEGEKEEIPVLIDEAVFNPISGDFLHVVLKQVSLTKKIEATVKIEVVGEFKLDDATLSLLKDEVEVEALPTDLPEKFEINAERFTQIGQKLTLADLEFDKSKVELILKEGVKPEDVILVLIQEEKLQAEEPTEETPATPEAEGEEKARADGETASEEKTGNKAQGGEDKKD